MSDRSMSRRPLTASQRDQELYLETPELVAVRTAIDLGLNVFIGGGPGSGKTTLVRRLEYERDDVAVVQAEWETSVSGLIAAIAKAIGSSNLGTDQPTSTEDDVGQIAKALSERDQRSPTIAVVIVDGADKEQISVLFGRYRDALWELPVTWVVTSRSASPGVPADAFFDRIITIASWDAEHLVRLAEKRAPDHDRSYFDLVVDAVAPLYPAAALLALQSFLLSGDQWDLLERLTQERKEVAALPDRLRDLYDALNALGSAYASDERLLEKVGVSRSRVTHGLKELQERSLVEAERDGRRVRYRTALSILLGGFTASVDPSHLVSQNHINMDKKNFLKELQ